MKKVAKRTAACLLLVFFMAGGLCVYLAGYFGSGGDWVSFPVNRHAYSDAELSVGSVLDRNGVMLASMRNGERVFNDSESVRRAVLHVVGDVRGNIGTGALNFYADALMGYNPVNGVYSVSGRGSSMRLTVDSRLNAVALEALGGRKGAAVFYNYKTGEVLCMASAPAYDPYFPPSEAETELGEYDGVYINRCVSSVFTPGSVFKIVTLAAAIENIPDLFEMRFECPGYADVGGERINCSGVHGETDIYGAFANSCNAAFAELSQIIGQETLLRYAEDFGLAESFDMSGIPVAAGSFTASEDGHSDLSWFGIGQYKDLVNPAAMARLMAAIANGGVAVTPKIVKDVAGEFGFPERPEYWFNSSKRIMKRPTADKLSEMMRYNTEKIYGEYYGLGGYEGLSAKSGTAETGDGKPPHAWFTGFLNSEKYPVAFSVIVENGGWGLQQAAPIVDAVLASMVE